MMKRPVFTGAATALVTPMTKEGKLNLTMLEKLVEWQIQSGIDALVPCGTTGECATLSSRERSRVIEMTVASAQGRVPVIAGAGSNDTAKSVTYCKAAKAAGANALLLVTPYYNKCTQKGLQEHFLRLADATDLPVILYNVPSRTGVSISLDSRIILCRHPQIVGIKEAEPNLSLVSNTIEACGEELAVYSGNDDLTLPILSLGGRGIISVASNLFPREMQKLCRYGADGDYESARSLHYSLLPLMNMLFCEVNPIPVKAAMEWIGFPCGPCRMPLCPIDDIYAEKLRYLIEKAKINALG